MIVPCLWYQGDLEAALERYRSLFDDFELHSLERMGPDVQLADWRMHGTEFRAISQAAEFRFNESMSLSVTCADQAEVDHYWDGLLAGGGEPSQCGWLTDAFGVSWQIVPKRLGELMSDPDPERAGRVMQAMLQMVKLDVAALEAAAEG